VAFEPQRLRRLGSSNEVSFRVRTRTLPALRPSLCSGVSSTPGGLKGKLRMSTEDEQAKDKKPDAKPPASKAAPGKGPSAKGPPPKGPGPAAKGPPPRGPAAKGPPPGGPGGGVRAPGAPGKKGTRRLARKRPPSGSLPKPSAGAPKGQTNADFGHCLEDVNYFIKRFEQRAEGPKGDRFSVPLDRLRTLKRRLREMGKAHIRDQRESAGPIMLDPETISSHLGELTSAYKQIAQKTKNVEGRLGKIEGMEKRLFSVASSSVEAAESIRRLGKDLGNIKEAGASAGSGASVDIGPVLAALEQGFATMSTKVEGLSPEVTLPAAIQDLPESLGKLVDGLSKSVESVDRRTERIQERLTAMEKVSLAVGGGAPAIPAAGTDEGDQAPGGAGTLAVGTAVSLDLSIFSGPVDRLHDRLDKLDSKLDERLDGVYGRLGALDALSMVLHPLTSSLQEVTQAVAKSTDMGDKFDDLSLRLRVLSDAIEPMRTNLQIVQSKLERFSADDKSTELRVEIEKSAALFKNFASALAESFGNASSNLSNLSDNSQSAVPGPMTGGLGGFSPFDTGDDD